MTSEYIGRAEACRLLNVKPQTLYAYVSRGLVRSAQSPGKGQTGLYARSDVETLKQRRRARTGHGPVAASAMRWGEPVLESAITRLGDDDIYYRGIPLRQLVQRRVSFERCSELIWSGILPSQDLKWDAYQKGKASSSIDLSYSQLNSALAVASSDFAESTLDETLASVRRFLVGVLSPLASKNKETSFAGRVADKLGLHGNEAATILLNSALVVSADFELSASTFAGRIAASTGAEIFACLQASLAAFSGRIHGAQVDQTEAFVFELLNARDSNTMAISWARNAEQLPGFGQKLYPKGDPRAEALLIELQSFMTTANVDRQKELKKLAAAAKNIQTTTGLAPNLEWALTLMGRALDLKPKTIFGIFALGRMVGWVAHVIEQRQQGYVLRPRAKYTGR